MLLFIKNLLFTVIVPGTVAVYAPWALADATLDGLTTGWGPRQLLALPLLLLGAAIYSWCLWDFATFGMGTPAPIDAPRRLVVRGLYHHVRNPMYVGVLTVIFGWASFFGSARIVVYAAIVWVAFHTFVTLAEEPKLRQLFGDDYERYCTEVGRWIPRLARNTHQDRSEIA